MIKLICDKCKKEIKNPRKSFIFLAEKFGVLKNDCTVSAEELPTSELYNDSLPIMTDLHRQRYLFCSECTMTLWKAIQKFAEDSEYLMEDKN